MTRFSLFFSSICSLFVLSWVLTRWFGPENCINSTLVGKVVINSGESETKRCTPIIRLLDGAPAKIVASAQLLSRINQLEKLAPFLNHEESELTININTQSRHELMLQGHSIRISADNLESKNLLERAILFLKLNNNSPLTASATADFLLEEFKYKKNDLAPRPWVSFVGSLHSYCQSAGVLLVHYDFCQTQNELDDSYIISADSTPVSWSLAPVYTQILKDIYRSSTLRGKQAIMSNLIFLGELEDTFIAEISGSKSILSYEDSFFQMLRDWLMPLMINEELLESVIAKYKIKHAKNINYLYVGRSSRDVFPLAFSERVSQQSKKLYLMQTGTNQFFYPSDIPVRMLRTEVYETFKVENTIYVSCDMPEVESLLEFDGLANRVLYIRQCSEDEIDWDSVVSIGLNEYLKSNANIEFVEFNVSALKLAKKVRGPLLDSDNFIAWQKWLLWQRIISDDGPQVQRPLSAIDGVRRFRIF